MCNVECVTLILLFSSEGKEESEYMLRWSEHNNQLISIFHQLCQVLFILRVPVNAVCLFFSCLFSMTGKLSKYVYFLRSFYD
jgi:hypothetical protein